MPAASDATWVLMPGLDGTGMMFSSLTSHWRSSAAYRCIDYPASLPARLEAYVEHVMQQLESLDRVVLVAESFSGPVAILLVAKLGSRLAGLVLCASFATSPSPWVGLARYCPSRLIELGSRQPFLLRHYCLGSDAYPDVVQRLLTVLSDVNGPTIAQRLTLLEKLDVRTALRSCMAPLLLLQAGRDRLLSARAIRQLVEAAPQATVTTLNGPHLLLQTEPQACLEAMMRWSANHDFALRTIDA